MVLGAIGTKSLAEVAEPGGSEQGVDHRMGEHIRIRVARKPLLVRHLDPAKEERARTSECMHIKSAANP
jgi:hypothetical protein